MDGWRSFLYGVSISRCMEVKTPSIPVPFFGFCGGIIFVLAIGMRLAHNLPHFKDVLQVPPFIFIKDERTLTGSYMGTTQYQTEIPKLVELYKAGILKLDELISGHFPLEEINHAIELVEQGKALRNVIMFE